MKRVIYNTSNADPFIKVAQKLKLDYGFEPVYWIGFNYDNSDISCIPWNLLSVVC